MCKICVAMMLIVSTCRCHIDENSQAQIEPDEITHVRQQKLFSSIREVVEDERSTPWYNRSDTIDPWLLHFNETTGSDTLWTEFAPECWCMFPMTVLNDTIEVYWAPQLDTKYDFKIVQAINKLHRQFWGEPFLRLWLKNDTTLEAHYTIGLLMHELEQAGDNRLRFPKEFHPMEESQ